MVSKTKLQFDRNACLDLERSLRREWLETNGNGGFASSTSILCHNRKYHSLLCLPLEGLSGRYNLLSDLEFSMAFGDREFHLATHKYPNVFYPTGHKYMVRADFDPYPNWQYRIGDMTWSFSLVMPDQQPTVLVRWTYLKGLQNVNAQVRPLLAFRDMHSLAQENMDADVHTHFQRHGWSFAPYSGLPHLHVNSSRQAGFHPGPYWNRQVEYIKERSRGYPYHEDLLCPGVLETTMTPGDTLTLAFSLSPQPDPDALWEREQGRRQSVGDLLESRSKCFVVNRKQGQGIIAGYPWFDEWGRDSLIALPGLSAVQGDDEVAINVLQAISDRRVRGLIPNTLPLGPGPVSTNSIDATLWFGWSLWHCQNWSSDPARYTPLLRVVEPLIETLLNPHQSEFSVEPNGLIWAGNRNTNLTWMDARVDNVPVTPRYGYAVEINGLWLHLLWLKLEHRPNAKIRRLFERAQTSFMESFWDTQRGCLYDVVDDFGPDPAVRPNQLIAASLPAVPLSRSQLKQILAVVEHHLVTPYGLRTLSPEDRAYHPHYEGTQPQRDRAYHQGTVWPWLIGVYADTLLRSGDPKAASAIQRFHPLWTDHLVDGGLGYISEVFSGDPPHPFEGCIAQAWSMAEVIRVRRLLKEAKLENS